MLHHETLYIRTNRAENRFDCIRTEHFPYHAEIQDYDQVFSRTLNNTCFHVLVQGDKLHPDFVQRLIMAVITNSSIWQHIELWDMGTKGL